MQNWFAYFRSLAKADEDQKWENKIAPFHSWIGQRFWESGNLWCWGFTFLNYTQLQGIDDPDIQEEWPN